MGNVSTQLGTAISADTTINTDSSKAFGGQTVSNTDTVGSNYLFGGEGNAVTVNALDPAGLLVGKDVAMAGLSVAQDTAKRAVAIADSAIDKALALAGMSQQGSGGTIIKGLIWLALIGAGAFVLWAVFGRRKKKKKED